MNLEALKGKSGLLKLCISREGIRAVAGALKDSDLEAYYKHFLLSDAVAFPKDTHTFPVDYSRQLLANREKLMDDADEETKRTLMNPADALVSLYDIIVCPLIRFTPLEKSVNTYSSNSVFTGGRRGLPMTAIAQKYQSFEIEMTFLQFVDISSDLQKGLRLYLYPRGIEQSDEINMLDHSKYDFQLSIDFKKDGDQAGKVKYTFSIPSPLREQLSTSSELVFALQVINEKGPGFPLLLNNKSRYLGVKFALGDWGVGITTLFMKENQQAKVKILPLKQLRLAHTWR